MFRFRFRFRFRFIGHDRLRELFRAETFLRLQDPVPADAPTVVASVCAVVAVGGAVVAFLVSKLSSTLVAVILVVAGCAGVGLATGGPALAALLLLGGMGVIVPVAAGIVVVDLDARPPRTLRPWRLLMLLPVPALVWSILPLFTRVPTAVPAGLTTASSSTDAALVALLALAAAGPAALLLLRRREAE